MKKTLLPASSLRGAIELPPDKSIAHRSALFAALHEGNSRIENYSPAQDPQSTLTCLATLGVSIKDCGANTIEIEGVGRDGFNDALGHVDCGNSGTTMRLLSGIIAGAGVRATLIGDDSLSKRPMRRILDPLRLMGAQISAQADDLAPLAFSPSKLTGIDYRLPVASAQVKSAVLLAGLFAEGQTRVLETQQSRNHTELMLEIPSKVVENGCLWICDANTYIPNQSMRIPGDFSAAAFWLVGGSIVENSHLELLNVGLNPTRTGALNILKRMGAEILTHSIQENRELLGSLTVKSTSLKATCVSGDEIPNAIDELPILAVAMAFAEGVSSIKDAAELRVKETDRIAAVAEMLRSAGVDVTEREDGLDIVGKPSFRPKPSQYNSHGDHRLAMASAILGLKAVGSSSLEGAEAAAVSYVNFWNHLSQLAS